MIILINNTVLIVINIYKRKLGLYVRKLLDLRTDSQTSIFILKCPQLHHTMWTRCPQFVLKFGRKKFFPFFFTFLTFFQTFFKLFSIFSPPTAQCIFKKLYRNDFFYDIQQQWSRIRLKEIWEYWCISYR